MCASLRLKLATTSLRSQTHLCFRHLRVIFYIHSSNSQIPWCLPSFPAQPNIHGRRIDGSLVDVRLLQRRAIATCLFAVSHRSTFGPPGRSCEARVIAAALSLPGVGVAGAVFGVWQAMEGARSGSGSRDGGGDTMGGGGGDVRELSGACEAVATVIVVKAGLLLTCTLVAQAPLRA